MRQSVGLRAATGDRLTMTRLPSGSWGFVSAEMLKHLPPRSARHYHLRRAAARVFRGPRIPIEYHYKVPPGSVVEIAVPSHSMENRLGAIGWVRAIVGYMGTFIFGDVPVPFGEFGDLTGVRVLQVPPWRPLE